MRTALFVVIASALSFAQTSLAHEPVPAAMTKRPIKAPEMEPGPKIHPPKALLAWLNDAKNKGAYVRLPVVFQKTKAGGEHWGQPYVGVPGDAPSTERIYLTLDDTTLGMSLMMRLDSMCKKGGIALSKEGDRCHVLIDGRWGSGLVLSALKPKIDGAKAQASTKRWPVLVRDTAALDPNEAKGATIWVTKGR